MRKRPCRFAAPLLIWGGGVILLSLAVCAVRGCAYTPPGAPGSSPEIDVYDHDAHTTVTMPLEEYLISVLGAEMPASFPLEALKAQAVAARTYAVRRIEGYGGSGCPTGADICTDSGCCQAYSDMRELERRFSGEDEFYLDKLREAVSGTHGEIAVYGGEPIEALYHSSSGGRTEDAQNVFSSALPYLVGVSSPGEESSSKYTAQYSYTAREFASLINGEWSGAGLDRRSLKEDVAVLSRHSSGQVKELRLGGVTVSGKQLRKLLGLNSANFTIEVSSGVLITTTGYGHGVGMSQYGARAMALDGAGYADILRHYYTGASLRRAY